MSDRTTQQKPLTTCIHKFLYSLGCFKERLITCVMQKKVHFGLTFGACTIASVSYIGACTTIRGGTTCPDSAPFFVTRDYQIRLSQTSLNKLHDKEDILGRNKISDKFFKTRTMYPVIFLIIYIMQEPFIRYKMKKITRNSSSLQFCISSLVQDTSSILQAS